VVLLAFLATGTGVANAAEAQLSTTDATSFGLLGPVGLAAVVLGIVGMALGVVRQRRKAAQAPAEPAPQISEDVAAQPLTPYRRPTV
jgi:hypothetical protein